MTGSSPVTPGSLQVPAAPGAPVIVDFGVHALRAAFARKESILELPPAWAAPGVYCLIGTVGGADNTLTYVGKAINVRKRLIQHRTKPPIDWWRAIAVVRDTTDGFNSAEIGYLEGRLAKEIEHLPNLTLQAGKYDLDTTLPSHMLVQLDSFVPTVLSALRVAGLDMRQADPVSMTVESKSHRQIVPGKISDLLAEGLLSAGASLTFKSAGKSAVATVTASGELIVDGKSYASPSKAAAAALDLTSANGWISWRLDGGSGLSLDELRKQLPAKLDDIS